MPLPSPKTFDAAQAALSAQKAARPQLLANTVKGFVPQAQRMARGAVRGVQGAVGGVLNRALSKKFEGTAHTTPKRIK